MASARCQVWISDPSRPPYINQLSHAITMLINVFEYVWINVYLNIYYIHFIYIQMHNIYIYINHWSAIQMYKHVSILPHPECPGYVHLGRAVNLCTLPGWTWDRASGVRPRLQILQASSARKVEKKHGASIGLMMFNGIKWGFKPFNGYLLGYFNAYLGDTAYTMICRLWKHI